MATQYKRHRPLALVYAKHDGFAVFDRDPLTCAYATMLFCGNATQVARFIEQYTPDHWGGTAKCGWWTDLDEAQESEEGTDDTD